MAVAGLAGVFLVGRQNAFRHLGLMTIGVQQVSAGCIVAWEWPLPIGGHVLTDFISLNTISPKVSGYGHLCPWGSPFHPRGTWCVGWGSYTGDLDR